MQIKCFDCETKSRDAAPFAAIGEAPRRNLALPEVKCPRSLRLLESASIYGAPKSRVAPSPLDNSPRPAIASHRRNDLCNVRVHVSEVT